MIQHDVLGGLGYGISQYPADPDPRFVIRVDTDNRNITIGDKPPMSFAGFVNSDMGW
jgi:hypothetical protein